MDFDAPPVIVPADFTAPRRFNSLRSTPRNRRPGQERRRRQRDGVTRRCEIHIADGSHAATIIDLSSDGVGVWSATALAIGDDVEVSIPLGRFRSLELAATAAVCRPMKDGAWRIGLHFFRRLTVEELVAALG